MKQILANEVKNIYKFNSSSRPWHLPFCAGLSASVPIFWAAFFGDMRLGAVASMAAMVFLYMPQTAILPRMAVMLAASYGMILSFILGALAHLESSLTPLVLGIACFATTAVTRVYQMPSPGNFFFLMTAVLAAYMPFDANEFIAITGYFVFGTIWACLVALGYGLITAKKVEQSPQTRILYEKSEILGDSMIIALFVGLSVYLANLIGMDRPYWVPISTLAILQGMTLHSTWTRQIHRILGTGVGIVLTYFLLLLQPGNYTIAFLIGAMLFATEMLVVRNYGFAAIFITCLTVFMAEMSEVVSGSPTQLITARIFDIIFGSVIGFLGGLCLHLKFLRKLIKF